MANDSQHQMHWNGHAWVGTDTHGYALQVSPAQMQARFDQQAAHFQGGPNAGMPGGTPPLQAAAQSALSTGQWPADTHGVPTPPGGWYQGGDD